jgi:hypothetical protein
MCINLHIFPSVAQVIGFTAASSGAGFGLIATARDLRKRRKQALLLFDRPAPTGTLRDAPAGALRFEARVVRLGPLVLDDGTALVEVAADYQVVRAGRVSRSRTLRPGDLVEVTGELRRGGFAGPIGYREPAVKAAVLLENAVLCERGFAAQLGSSEGTTVLCVLGWIALIPLFVVGALFLLVLMLLVVKS